MADKSPPKQQTSAQMDAVMRLMTGKEERTIAEKFADSNRPTWEQYKKDNKDKLDIVGAETKQMQNYRKELDEQRERILARGVNHGASKKKSKRKRRQHHSDSDSSDEDRRSKKKRKKHKRKKHRKHHRSDSESDSSNESDSDDSRRKRKHKKKRKKHKKKSDKKDGSGEDERYRLSNFFTQASDDE